LIGFVPRRKAVPQCNIGALSDIDKTGIRMPDRGLSDDIMRQTFNFRI
jgi:hypothetical protein